MVAALLLVVALAVFQLGLALYVRNTLISAASEGARYGARADALARRRHRPHLGPHHLVPQPVLRPGRVRRRAHDLGGVRVVEVRVSAPLPVIGPIGPRAASP